VCRPAVVGCWPWWLAMWWRCLTPWFRLAWGVYPGDVGWLQAVARAQPAAVWVRPRVMRLRRLRAAVRRLSQALLVVVPR
jgi:hypothetical protein